MIIVTHFGSGEMLAIRADQIAVIVGDHAEKIDGCEPRRYTRIELVGRRAPVLVCQSPAEVLAMMKASDPADERDTKGMRRVPACGSELDAGKPDR